MPLNEDLRKEIYAHFEGDMNGSAPDSIRMLEHYAPGAMEGFYRLRRATTVDSSLPKQVRELIIIAVEAALKKDPVGHARIAVEAGATPQEIHDAVALSLWLAGMPAYHHGMKAVQAAEQLVAQRRSAPGGAATGGATVAAQGAHPATATYPAAPVTFVSGAPPGGGWHQLCERTAHVLKAEGLIPVEVVVETTPGGLKVFEETISGWRGDGYRLVAFSPGLTMQLLMKGSKYSYADVAPIAALSTDYGALVVPASSAIRDLRTLLNMLRRNPAGLPITGGSGPGAMHHGMVGVLAAAMGIPPDTVSYVGSGGVSEAIKKLLAGDVPVAALGAADVVNEARNGTLRLLAVFTELRLPAPLADVPTAREEGLDIVFPMWRGFYGPPAMPGDALRFWYEAFTRLSRTPTWNRVLEESGWFPFLLTGDAFRAFLDDDTQRYARALEIKATR